MVELLLVAVEVILLLFVTHSQMDYSLPTLSDLLLYFWLLVEQLDPNKFTIC